MTNKILDLKQPDIRPFHGGGHDLRVWAGTDFDLKCSKNLNTQEYFCSPEILEKFEHYRNYNFIMDKELSVTYVDNGIVHPLELSETQKPENRQWGGVTDDKMNFIDVSLQKEVFIDDEISRAPWYVGANPTLQENDVEYVDETVVFLGPIKKHFAHFYLETLSRIWFYFKKENLQFKAVYISNEWDNPREDLMNDFFTPFGLKRENIIKIDKPTKFKQVIIPDQSNYLQNQSHPLYKETIEKLKDYVKNDSENSCRNRKIFFSKKYNWVNTNRTIGDDIAEEIFRKNGYEIFYPEKMSLYEMISVLNGCSVLAAQSGANALNAVFLNDNAKVIVLHRSRHVHPTMLMLEQMRNLSVTYVDTYYNILPVNWAYGPFSFSYTEYLEAFLKKYKFKYRASKLRAKSTENLIPFLKAWGGMYNDDLVRTYLKFDNIDVDYLVNSLAGMDYYKPLTYMQKIKKEIKKGISKCIMK